MPSHAGFSSSLPLFPQWQFSQELYFGSIASEEYISYPFLLTKMVGGECVSSIFFFTEMPMT
jgi:hypothetical protein